MCKLKKKVVVAMSGGVDSSVSAWILKQKGYSVEGLFMKNWEEQNDHEYCTSEKDFKDAQNVCNQLNIPLRKVNFSYEYWENVFKKFLSEHKIGRTPNPDILCNQEIKFKVLFDFVIKDLKFDYIATGHYVRKTRLSDKYLLLRSVDINKDQSYFLYTINQFVLKKCLFPVGELNKYFVRKIAQYLDLVVANKKDSTGICFINPKKISNLLNYYLPNSKGDIVTNSGVKIGIHYGLVHYTLGQRKGLGIGGIKGKNSLPWYVVNKNLSKNLLVVAQGINNYHLMSIGLIANKVCWINNINFKNILFCTAKIRYRHLDVLCKVILYKRNSIKVFFKKPISSVTPGQSIVLYSLNVCLGGGIIKKRFPVSVI